MGRENKAMWTAFSHICECPTWNDRLIPKLARALESPGNSTETQFQGPTAGSSDYGATTIGCHSNASRFGTVTLQHTFHSAHLSRDTEAERGLSLTQSHPANQQQMS